ncbi:MAG TPA: hypothetical protein DER60_06560 [Syntrophomonas sp.]|jgi:hypothetical protein|nr:hypothetical protein [Syntrophomonas sp.]
MGFVNQVSQTQFLDQNIKTLKVLCTQCIQENGEITISAPSGVTLDVTTGQLNVPVTLELAGSPQIRNITVLQGKVVNEGIVPVRLLVDGQEIIKLLEIPFQGIVECSGVEPGDNIQKHDLQVEGLIVSPVRLITGDLACLTLNLILKAIVKACIVISRETILKINAANPFCTCP